MNWWMLKRGDVAGFLLAAVVVGVLLAGYVFFPNGFAPFSNWGFGPEWDCTFHPDSGGPPTYLRTLGRELVRRGHRVRVVTYGDAPGHACLAVSGPLELVTTLETGSADREANMWRFARAALELLLSAMR